jgi:hypothetical protein
MFDGNMVGSWRTFTHLKGIGRLRSKTSNIAEPMKAEYSPRREPILMFDGNMVGSSIE